MCERATGLSLLFTVVCLRTSSLIVCYGMDDSQGKLSALLVRSVSYLCEAGDALSNTKVFQIACD